MTNADMHSIRQAIIEALPAETSKHGTIPSQSEVYTPPSHLKALRLECNLVIGARGVGKTFWSAALQSPEIRDLLGEDIAGLAKAEVRTGYGERSNLDAYPDVGVFQQLLENGAQPYRVWQAVVARWLAAILEKDIPRSAWSETVHWVSVNPEPFGRMLEGADAKFTHEDTIGVMVFDALDRAHDDWKTLDVIVRDLLQLVLSLKRFPRLHGKVFLREDQFEGRQITDFTDASKLFATRVELTWAPRDLHGLLWQYLCNAPGEHGTLVRRLYQSKVGTPPEKLADHGWAVTAAAKRDEATQRALFIALAGQWMGKDRRRGIPYTWTVGHLADGRGRTSPRSFLAAIRGAVEDSLDRYPEFPTPLHYESIKRGVQQASKIRVSELAEDYPWVKKLMEPLRGLTVPCAFSAVLERWTKEMGEDPAAMKTSARLPPEHFEQGWDGVRLDLEKLGVLERMKDGRVNMPDLYRVGFGLGRRGGVKPVSRSTGE